MQINILKKISASLVFVLLVTQIFPTDIVQAFQTNLPAGYVGYNQIRFPEFTKVEWRTPASTAFSAGVVYVIQDAHTSLISQQCITQTLQKLQQQRALDAVLVEGASGPLTDERFYDHQDLKTNSQFIEKLERAGYLHGAAAYYLLRPETLALGLEIPQLYLQNFMLFRKVFGLQKNIQPMVSKLQVEWQRWMKNHVPSQYQGFFLNSTLRHTDYADWAYFPQLIQMGTDQLKINWSIQDQTLWPQLIRIQRILKIQKSLDFQKVKKTFELLKKTLSPVWKEEIKQVEIRMNHRQVNGVMPEDARFYRAFAAKLVVELKNKNQSLLPYRTFFDWLAVETFRNEIQIEQLMQEMEQVEKQVWRHWFQNPNDQARMELGRLSVLLDKASRLELSRREVRQFQNALQSPVFKFWIVRLPKEQQIQFVQFARVVLDFYRAAEARETGFLRKIYKVFKILHQKENSKPLHIAVVVGGYHQEGLLEALKTKNFEVALVTPQSESVDHNVAYLERMLANQSAVSTTAFPPAAVIGRNELKLLEGDAVAASTEKVLDQWLGVNAKNRSETRTNRRSWISQFILSGALVFAGKASAADRIMQTLDEINRLPASHVDHATESLTVPKWVSSTEWNPQAGFQWNFAVTVDEDFLEVREVNLQALIKLTPEARLVAMDVLAKNENRRTFFTVGPAIVKAPSGASFRLNDLGTFPGGVFTPLLPVEILTRTLPASTSVLSDIVSYSSRKKADQLSLTAWKTIWQAQVRDSEAYAHLMLVEIRRMEAQLRWNKKSQENLAVYLKYARLREKDQRLERLGTVLNLEIQAGNLKMEQFHLTSQLETKLAALAALLGVSFSQAKTIATNASIPVLPANAVDQKPAQVLNAALDELAKSSPMMQAADGFVAVASLDQKVEWRKGWFGINIPFSGVSSSKLTGKGNAVEGKTPAERQARLNQEAMAARLDALENKLGIHVRETLDELFSSLREMKQIETDLQQSQSELEARAPLQHLVSLPQLETTQQIREKTQKLINLRAKVSSMLVELMRLNAFKTQDVFQAHDWNLSQIAVGEIKKRSESRLFFRPSLVAALLGVLFFAVGCASVPHSQVDAAQRKTATVFSTTKESAVKIVEKKDVSKEKPSKEAEVTQLKSAAQPNIWTSTARFLKDVGNFFKFSGPSKKTISSQFVAGEADQNMPWKVENAEKGPRFEKFKISEADTVISDAGNQPPKEEKKVILEKPVQKKKVKNKKNAQTLSPTVNTVLKTVSPPVSVPFSVVFNDKVHVARIGEGPNGGVLVYATSDGRVEASQSNARLQIINPEREAKALSLGGALKEEMVRVGDYVGSASLSSVESSMSALYQLRLKLDFIETARDHIEQDLLTTGANITVVHHVTGGTIRKGDYLMEVFPSNVAAWDVQISLPALVGTALKMTLDGREIQILSQNVLAVDDFKHTATVRITAQMPASVNMKFPHQVKIESATTPAASSTLSEGEPVFVAIQYQIDGEIHEGGSTVAVHRRQSSVKAAESGFFQLKHLGAITAGGLVAERPASPFIQGQDVTGLLLEAKQQLSDAEILLRQMESSQILATRSQTEEYRAKVNELGASVARQSYSQISAPIKGYFVPDVRAFSGPIQGGFNIGTIYENMVVLGSDSNPDEMIMVPKKANIKIGQPATITDARGVVHQGHVSRVMDNIPTGGTEAVQNLKGVIVQLDNPVQGPPFNWDSANFPRKTTLELWNAFGDSLKSVKSTSSAEREPTDAEISGGDTQEQKSSEVSDDTVAAICGPVLAAAVHATEQAFSTSGSPKNSSVLANKYASEKIDKIFKENNAAGRLKQYQRYRESFSESEWREFFQAASSGLAWDAAQFLISQKNWVLLMQLLREESARNSAVASQHAQAMAQAIQSVLIDAGASNHRSAMQRDIQNFGDKIRADKEVRIFTEAFFVSVVQSEGIHAFSSQLILNSGFFIDADLMRIAATLQASPDKNDQSLGSQLQSYFIYSKAAGQTEQLGYDPEVQKLLRGYNFHNPVNNATPENLGIAIAQQRARTADITMLNSGILPATARQAFGMVRRGLLTDPQIADGVQKANGAGRVSELGNLGNLTETDSAILPEEWTAAPSFSAREAIIHKWAAAGQFDALTIAWASLVPGQDALGVQIARSLFASSEGMRHFYQLVTGSGFAPEKFPGIDLGSQYFTRLVQDAGQFAEDITTSSRALRYVYIQALAQRLNVASITASDRDRILSLLAALVPHDYALPALNGVNIYSPDTELVLNSIPAEFQTRLQAAVNREIGRRALQAGLQVVAENEKHRSVGNVNLGVLGSWIEDFRQKTSVPFTISLPLQTDSSAEFVSKSVSRQAQALPVSPDSEKFVQSIAQSAQQTLQSVLNQERPVLKFLEGKMGALAAFFGFTALGVTGMGGIAGSIALASIGVIGLVALLVSVRFYWRVGRAKYHLFQAEREHKKETEQGKYVDLAANFDSLKKAATERGASLSVVDRVIAKLNQSQLSIQDYQEIFKTLEQEISNQRKMLLRPKIFQSFGSDDRTDERPMLNMMIDLYATVLNRFVHESWFDYTQHGSSIYEPARHRFLLLVAMVNILFDLKNFRDNGGYSAIVLRETGFASIDEHLRKAAESDQRRWKRVRQAIRLTAAAKIIRKYLAQHMADYIEHYRALGFNENELKQIVQAYEESVDRRNVDENHVRRMSRDTPRDAAYHAALRIPAGTATDSDLNLPPIPILTCH